MLQKMLHSAESTKFAFKINICISLEIANLVNFEERGKAVDIPSPLERTSTALERGSIYFNVNDIIYKTINQANLRIVYCCKTSI